MAKSRKPIEEMTAVEVLAAIRKLPAEECMREYEEAQWVTFNGQKFFLTDRDRLDRRADQLIREANLDK